MTLEEIINVCEGDDKEERAKKIYDLRNDIFEYTFFKRSVDLGITYKKEDLTFNKFLLYSLIKEKMDG